MFPLPSPALIGVIHLAPLPGSPAHCLPMEQIIERGLADGRTLRTAGFDAAIVENLGDAPFTASQLPPASIAAMALVAEKVRLETGLVLGVNALRNDARAAVGIAAAVGASFVRVNVHVGVAATDQGMISGRADDTLRYRKLLGARVAILADVHVKHSTPISHLDIAAAARDTAYRGLADALIVTGRATGQPVREDDVHAVREAVPDRRVFIGSGASAETVAHLLTMATGVIVGSGIKPDGDVSLPIDAGLARDFARASGRQ